MPPDTVVIMNRSASTVRAPFTCPFLPRLVALAALITICALPRPASAQFSQLGAVLDLVSAGVLGTDIAYDPVNDQYLFVGAHGPVFATCTNPVGQVTMPFFYVMNNPAFFGHYPRAKFSPDANGGAGGFLVTWHQNDVPNRNALHGRIVSCVSGPTSGDLTISNIAEDGTKYTIGAPAAYSNTSQKFLVTWQTDTFGIRGRFVSANGAMLGGTMLLANVNGARDPGVAWNPGTNEFGFMYTGWDGSGAFAAFRTVRAIDGALSPLQKFFYGTGTYNTDITVNTETNSYVVGWVVLPGGSRFALFDYLGNLLNTGLMTTRFGGADNLAVSYNPLSGTILGAGSDNLSYEIAAIELNGFGTPISSAGGITQGSTAPGSFYPRVTARLRSGQWGLSFSRRYVVLGAQFVASGGGGGGLPPPPPPPPPGQPPPPTGGCSTPDPFAALGGGTCVNGGWLPPGSGGGGSGSGGGSSGGCSTPDPFASMGGGTCVNGGWIPGGGGGGSTSGGCTTPDPFAAIGGGTCVNGGWRPGGGGGGGGSTSGGCSTPDPFTAMGGGTCVNGGWIPGGGGGGGGSTSGGCTTPDPFGAMGGGTCVNGGWIPGGGGGGGSTAGGCTTPDPFTAMGGGTCINGGWQPGATATCSGLPDPFVAIGGGVCINGGWVPKGGRP